MDEDSTNSGAAFITEGEEIVSNMMNPNNEFSSSQEMNDLITYMECDSSMVEEVDSLGKSQQNNSPSNAVIFARLVSLEKKVDEHLLRMRGSSQPCANTSLSVDALPKIETKITRFKKST